MLGQHFVDQRLIPNAPPTRFFAELIEHARIDTDRDRLARFVAERRPTTTRRIAFNCSGDESGMSEKSIFRAVRRSLAATRAPRADEPDRFRIATSPQRVGHHRHAAVRGSAESPKPNFGARMLQVRAVQSLGIEEDGHGVIE